MFRGGLLFSLMLKLNLFEKSPRRYASAPFFKVGYVIALRIFLKWERKLPVLAHFEKGGRQAQHGGGICQTHSIYQNHFPRLTTVLS